MKRKHEFDENRYCDIQNCWQICCHGIGFSKYRFYGKKKVKEFSFCKRHYEIFDKTGEIKAN